MIFRYLNEFTSMRLPAIFTALNSEIVLSKLVLLECTRCFIKNYFIRSNFEILIRKRISVTSLVIDGLVVGMFCVKLHLSIKRDLNAFKYKEI